MSFLEAEVVLVDTGDVDESDEEVPRLDVESQVLTVAAEEA